MNLEELKRIRIANLKAHKEKKKAYYLKKKLQGQSVKEPKPVDYAKELFSGNFKDKIKEIVKKQKLYVDDRKDIIVAKMQEYREKKQQYYKQNKEQRLEYDKIYRQKKKDDLKAYRKEYYQKNKEKILAQQKASRLSRKSNDGN